MKGSSNDNDDTWQTLSAATERVLRLDEKQDEKATDDGDRARRDQQKRDTNEEYVQRRLSDFARFEAMFSDTMKRRRR